MPTPISECLYCQDNETLHNLMIKICDLEVSQLFLFKEQSYQGRCNVVYNDHTISHLHIHVVPKYKDGYGFGGVFEMNPQKIALSESEYAGLIEKIKMGLE